MTLRRKSGGYVYVIKHEHGFAKIGESHDPMDRLNSLSTATPYDLFLFTTIEIVGDRTEVESALHQIYGKSHVSGEWFDIDEEDFQHLAQIDQLFESVVESVGGWTPEVHLDLTEEELKGLRATEEQKKINEQVEELSELIESGDFPEDNVHAENPAIKKHAKAANISPERLIAEFREATADDTNGKNT